MVVISSEASTSLLCPFLFQGFLSAFQGIIRELKLGQLSQISTIDHHCLIQYEGDRSDLPINIILMFDCEDCVDFWRQKAKVIGCEFIKMFSGQKFTGNVDKYKIFKERMDSILEMDYNMCLD